MATTNRPAKTLALVLSAIRNLSEIKGSTSREILSYISNVYDIPSKAARRQMQMALKRGVAYGILQKNGLHYALPTSIEPKCQDLAVPELSPMDRCGPRRRKPRRCRCKKKKRRRRSACDMRSCKTRKRKRRKSRKRCRCGRKKKREDRCPDTPDGSSPQKKSLTQISMDTKPNTSFEKSEYSSVSSLSSQET